MRQISGACGAVVALVSWPGLARPSTTGGAGGGKSWGGGPGAAMTQWGPIMLTPMPLCPVRRPRDALPPEPRQMRGEVDIGLIIGAVIAQRCDNDLAGAHGAVVALRPLLDVAAPEIQPVILHAARVDTAFDMHAGNQPLALPRQSDRPRLIRGDGRKIDVEHGGLAPADGQQAA